MTAAVYENSAIAVTDKRWNLIAPIATMSEATVQQDQRRTRSVCGVPDSSVLVFDVTLFICDPQRRSALGFEFPKFVIVDFHSIPDRFVPEQKSLLSIRLPNST